MDSVCNKDERANITLNYDKCKFRRTSITILGEKISEKGIYVESDPEKVEAIREWEKPTDVQTLRSFFGMLNFVVKFISNLSARTTSMRNLLQKGTVWILDENHDQEFEDMKRTLMTKPV